ncbi:Protein containing LysM domain [Magnetospirillum sp. UT-4]|nr:Protein containing LysM domain [Magnetospirillum sp. UT-4]
MVGFVAAAVAVVLALSLERDDTRSYPPPPASLPPAAQPANPGSTGPAPGFDVVRIGEKGDAVIAGHAMPKAEMVIRDGERLLGRTVADGRGEWVFVPELPMAPGPHHLGLVAINPTGATVAAANPVILVVPEAGSEPAYAVKPLAEGGARLLSGASVGEGGLSIDILDRETKGRIFIGGRAPAGGAVQVYGDNRFLGRAVADEEGTWRVRPKAVAPATRALRADLVDERGRVKARVEAPYEAEVETAAGTAPMAVTGGNVVLRIGRKLGDGDSGTTVIYKAGGQKRDPAPVLPGQVTQPAAK